MPTKPNLKVTDDEIVELMKAGATTGWQLSKLLAEKGIKVSPQAMKIRLERLREGKEERERLLPWEVKRIHSDGNSLYQSILAYAHWRKGDPLKAGDLKAAREFETRLSDRQVFPPNGAVMKYEPRRGFVLRNRRPDDGPDLLVVS